MACVVPATASWLRAVAAAALTSQFTYPLIALFFGAPMSPLLLQAAFRRLRGKRVLKVIAPSDAVAAAIMDKRHGQHAYVSANGLTFHYVESGAGFKKGGGPLVLFMHGFPEFWYSWRNQLAALGKQGFHCVAVDLRGYGWTEKPQRVQDYRIETLIEDVRALIVALGYADRGCILVGHDWGGNVAWYAAHVLGKQWVRAMCIMNCPHPRAFIERGSFRQFLRSWYFYVWQLPLLPELAMAHRDYHAIGASFRGTTMGVRRPTATMTPTDVAVMKHAFSQPGVGTGAINYYRANMFRPLPRDVYEKLRAKLGMPVLVLWGDGDQALGMELNEGIEAAYAEDLRFQVIRGASHWVQVDAPEEVNQHLLQFCREQRQRIVAENNAGKQQQQPQQQQAAPTAAAAGAAAAAGRPPTAGAARL